MAGSKESRWQGSVVLAILGKQRNNEPVGGGLVLNVEEAPLVQSNGVGVEDVGRVLVHGNGALRNTNNLGGSPSEYAEHDKHAENSEDNKTSRVALSEFPETKDHHHGETNEDYTEEDALEDCLPAVAEVSKLIVLQLSSLDECFADVLKCDHAQNDEEHEDDEESVASEKDVGSLDTSLEADTIHSTENETLASLSLSRS